MSLMKVQRTDGQVRTINTDNITQIFEENGSTKICLSVESYVHVAGDVESVIKELGLE